MKLLFGLGNPGNRYQHNRHNAGFLALDYLAEEYKAAFHDKPRLKSSIAEVVIGEEKALLAKPTTFYNLAGDAARAITDFYKIAPHDVLVLHDDIDLPFGTLRTRLGGSGGGSNGITSINQSIGQDYYRIRIGVANDVRARMDAVDFVLNNFTKTELEALTKELMPHIKNFAQDFVRGELKAHTILV